MAKEYNCTGISGVLSIENRLKMYADSKSEYDSERYEIMWHAWKHNKRWLSQLLEWILPSFPMYSRHGRAHAVSILHSIEMILGADQIADLSASDCFLILHVVYIHDIGMCITHEEREALMKNEEFIGFLKENEQNGNDVMRKYAELLLRHCKDKPEKQTEADLLKVKLEVYYAILHLVAEYRRKEHSEQSKKLLDLWIDAPEKLGIGFSTSSLPSRFFYMVGASASVHNSSNFDDVMALDKIDTGYCHDYMHPRFAAVMLQLGDALDLDNDRFHPLVKDFMGELPHESERHFQKHKSIRRLRISPDKISIRADCENAEVLQLVCRECENIKDILKNASYHWSAVCPEELNVCLPEFEPEELLLKGQPIKEGLVNVRFRIQQTKAFNLLQGSNIYKKDNFVFLREIFQNAVDASKLEYWNEWKGSRWYDEKSSKNPDISNMAKCLSPVSYPAEIELHLAYKEKYGKKYLLMDTKKDVDEVDENLKKERKGGVGEKIAGVLVRVIDHGTGMTAEDIQAIADVGSIYNKRTKFVEEMPQWLRPTGEFGIGLQAAFLVADFIKAYTHPRTGEKYEVEFQATGDKGKGYICVTPLKEEDKPRTFGTQFEIFVWNEKTKHQVDLESWAGKDPYKNECKEEREMRRTREFEIQLALYLEDIIGECLFPVKLRVYDFEQNENETFVVSKLKNKIQKLDYSIFLNGKQLVDKGSGSDLDLEKKELEKNKEELDKDEKNLTWVYDLYENTDLIKGGVDDNFYYALDVKKVKLYLWNSENNVYACFGAERIQAMRKLRKDLEIDPKKAETKIFYKGVYVNTFSKDLDLGLLEYIDIKGKMDREHLAINRDDFTDSGYEKIREEIYLSVVKAAHNALEDCDEKILKEGEKHDCADSDKDNHGNEENSGKSRIYKEIESIIKEEVESYKKQKNSKDNNQKTIQEISDFNNKESAERIQTLILSAVGLATFAQIRSAATCLIPNTKKTCKNWNQLLKDISALIESYKGKNEEKEEKDPIGWTHSSFFNMKVNKLIIPGEKQAMEIVTEDRTKNIAELLYGFNKYAVVSKRNSENSSWEEYVVNISDGLDDKNNKDGVCQVCGDQKSSADNNRENRINIKDDIMTLKNQWLLKERRKQIKGIEQWGEDFRNAFKEFDKNAEEMQKKEDYQQHQIISWILGNIPSIALFSDKDSNIRINIMELEHTDSMYFDRNFKWNIYKRMIKTYESKGVERFSTVAFTGYCRLALQKNPPSVYFVKRGKFSRIGQRYNIIPFNAKVLKNIFEYKDKLKKVLNNILKNSDDINIDMKSLKSIWQHFCNFSKYIEDVVEKYVKIRQGWEDDNSDSCLNLLGFAFDQRDEFDHMKEDILNVTIKKKIGKCLKQILSERETGSDIGENEKTISQLEHYADNPNQLYKGYLEKMLLKCIQTKSSESFTEQDIITKYRIMLVNMVIMTSRENMLENIKIDCGLKKNFGKSDDKWNTMNKLIKDVSENSWIKLPKDQSFQLYELYVSEVVDEVIDNVVDEIVSEIVGKSADKSVKEIADMATKEVTAKAADEATDKVAGKTTDENADRTVNKATSEVVNKVSNEIESETIDSLQRQFKDNYLVKILLDKDSDNDDSSRLKELKDTHMN